MTRDRKLTTQVTSGLAVAIALGVLALGVPAAGHGARVAAGASTAASTARAAACPVAGQCGIDPQTNCPTGGPTGQYQSTVPPLRIAPPQKCQAVPTTLFYVNKVTNGRCASILFVQVKLQPGISEYESVVYSTIGLGTRWWADPQPPGDTTGAATHAGQTFSGEGVTYTVPSGYLAWDVGGGSSPSCPTIDPTAIRGAAGWGVIGSGASAGSGGPGAGGAGAGTMSVHGPTRLAFNVTFAETVTGTATGAADYVVSGEQLGWTPRCASTLLVEQRRSGWTLWPTGTGPVHGRFRLVARFYSRNHLRHGICSYLINRATKHTYAHAARYWSNA